jgi:hypothetical protein
MSELEAPPLPTPRPTPAPLAATLAELYGACLAGARRALAGGPGRATGRASKQAAGQAPSNESQRSLEGVSGPNNYTRKGNKTEGNSSSSGSGPGRLPQAETDAEAMDAALAAQAGTALALPVPAWSGREAAALPADLTRLAIPLVLPGLRHGELVFKLGNAGTRDPHRPACGLLLEVHHALQDPWGVAECPCGLIVSHLLFAAVAGARAYFRRGWRVLSENSPAEAELAATAFPGGPSRFWAPV